MRCRHRRFLRARQFHFGPRAALPFRRRWGVTRGPSWALDSPILADRIRTVPLVDGLLAGSFAQRLQASLVDYQDTDPKARCCEAQGRTGAHV